MSVDKLIAKEIPDAKDGIRAVMMETPVITRFERSGYVHLFKT
jgi:hypothetical protein